MTNESHVLLDGGECPANEGKGLGHRRPMRQSLVEESTSRDSLRIEESLNEAYK